MRRIYKSKKKRNNVFGRINLTEELFKKCNI